MPQDISDPAVLADFVGLPAVMCSSADIRVHKQIPTEMALPPKLICLLASEATPGSRLPVFLRMRAVVGAFRCR